MRQKDIIHQPEYNNLHYIHSVFDNEFAKQFPVPFNFCITNKYRVGRFLQQKTTPEDDLTLRI